MVKKGVAWIDLRSTIGFLSSFVDFDTKILHFFKKKDQALEYGVDYFEKLVLFIFC